jgi:gliding motility-associated-like protein
MVVGADKEGCFKDTAFVLMKVFPIPTVDAGQDVTINSGQTVDLVPTISNDVISAKWDPTSGVFRNFYPGITAKPMATTVYTVEVANAGGCTNRDQVTVNVICNNANIYIPNSFSPNGDGANDVFYPRGTGVFSIKALKIFNRWGEVVFEKNNFSANEAGQGWDGTYKGQKLSTDVFVYMLDVVCENSSVLTFKGNVALMQ